MARVISSNLKVLIDSHAGFQCDCFDLLEGRSNVLDIVQSWQAAASVLDLAMASSPIPELIHNVEFLHLHHGKDSHLK